MLTNNTIDLAQVDELTGVNSLWLACFYGHAEIVIMLAEAGADIFCTNRQEVNVLHLAIIKGYYHMV